jgi:hypothetical protein
MLGVDTSTAELGLLSTAVYQAARRHNIETGMTRRGPALTAEFDDGGSARESCSKLGTIGNRRSAFCLRKPPCMAALLLTSGS